MNEQITTSSSLIELVFDENIRPGVAYLMPPNKEMGRILAYGPDFNPEDLARMFAVEITK